MDKKFTTILSSVILIAALLLNASFAFGQKHRVPEDSTNGNVDSVSEIENARLQKMSSANYAHGVTKTGENTFAFSYNGATYKNEYERLLAEDGFIYGMDWDWFGTWTEGTTSFGNNEITGYPSVYRAEYVERSLYNMKAMGFNAVSVWITNDGSGITYGETGLATGLNQSFIKNFTAFLNSCRKVGIDFVPTLLVHGYARNYNQASLGLSVQQKYYRYFRYYYEDEAREAFLTNVIEPICTILADYQDIVPMVDLTVENGTNAVNDPENGMLYTSYFGTTWENVCKLINGLHDATKKYMPNVYTSVEDVGWENNAFKYNDLKVDIIGRNEYTPDGSVADLSKRFITRPAYLGEYNVSERNDVLNSHTEEYFKNARLRYLESAIKGGYIGAFYYNWNNEGGGARCFFNTTSCDDYEAIRNFVAELSYKIIDLKNAHRKNTVYDYPPVLLYNNGSTTNYWIAGKSASYYILERSDNGGAWHVIADHIDASESVLTNGLVKYKDATMAENVTYQYRVKAVLNSGKTVISETGNELQLFVPTELLVDSNGNYMGGFEEGALTGKKNQTNSDGWFDAAWGSKIGEFVTDVSRSGNYSIYTNVAEGIGTNADYSAKWAYNLELEPNTLYELTYWYKNAAGSVSITVRPQNADKNLCFGSVATTEDNEWHKGSVRFSVPSDGRVRIVIMSMRNDATKFYLDDFSITEAR